MKKLFYCLFTLTTMISNSLAQELVIGEERVEPGIVLIFEGAIKDVVVPESNNLSIDQTNVHIEARVNWDSTNIPDGTPPGGFVPYLKISSIIFNENTGLKTFIDLTPHINMIDNFHYARNISLPGEVDDLYTVEFKINAPHEFDLAFHKDWLEKNFGEKTFFYKNYNHLNTKMLTLKKLTKSQQD